MYPYAKTANFTGLYLQKLELKVFTSFAPIGTAVLTVPVKKKDDPKQVTLKSLVSYVKVVIMK